MLEGGADCNAFDEGGDTPLCHALRDQLQWGHGAISRLLKDYGALAEPYWAPDNGADGKTTFYPRW